MKNILPNIARLTKSLKQKVVLINLKRVCAQSHAHTFSMIHTDCCTKDVWVAIHISESVCWQQVSVKVKEGGKKDHNLSSPPHWHGSNFPFQKLGKRAVAEETSSEFVEQMRWKIESDPTEWRSWSEMFFKLCARWLCSVKGYYRKRMPIWKENLNQKKSDHLWSLHWWLTWSWKLTLYTKCLHIKQENINIEGNCEMFFNLVCKCFFVCFSLMCNVKAVLFLQSTNDSER